MLTIEPLSDIAGARITGLDLAQELPSDVFLEVEQALHSHAFVVFPGQTVSPQRFMRFSRLWGMAEPHVIDTFHHPAEANILLLSNVSRDGKPIGLLDAGTYFHTDYSYLTVPARCTMLYAIQMPRERSGTTFANQTRAYAELPAETQKQIDGMEDAQALALLRSLAQHACADRYRHTYNYAVGDLVVWDNAQLLHCAPLTQVTDARTLWRITVKEAA